MKTPYQTRHEYNLDAMRGVLLALVLGVVVWAVVILIVWVLR